MKRERSDKTREKKQSFALTLLVLAALAVIGIVQVVVWDNYEGLPVAMTFITLFAGLAAWAMGYGYEDIEAGIFLGVRVAALPVLIIFVVGMLIATFIGSGAVPFVVYFGLKLISPNIFLVATCLICAIGSLATGSALTSVATFGVVLVGIASGMGIPGGMAAGAVGCGAVFGDKLSPLSDTTNIAAGVTGTNIFEHIRKMLVTTVPAFVISMIIFGILGAKYRGGSIDTASIENMMAGIDAMFNMNPLVLLPFVTLFVLAFSKVNVLGSMLASVVVGMFCAIVFQGYPFSEIWNALTTGIVVESGVPEVDQLLSKGGIMSILHVIVVMLGGTVLCGIMEKIGMVEMLFTKMEPLLKTEKRLIIGHIISGFLGDIVGGAYVGIILPSRVYERQYRKLKIKRSVQSRTCEDGATMAVWLVPWWGGLFFPVFLGVSFKEGVPYTFMAWLAPLIAIVFALMGWFIEKEDDVEE